MKLIVTFLLCVILLPEVLLSQEVVIKGFPLGVGRSVNDDFFKPYHNDLQKIADALLADKLAVAIITGGADGETYRIDDNTKNPALAVGRAHTLRNYLTTQLGVNPNQIVVSSEESTTKGANSRYVSVHISTDSKELSQVVKRVHNLEENATSGNLMARIEALEQKPPVEKHFTEVQMTQEPFRDKFGIQVSAGVSSSPFGGIPIIGGAVTWEKNLFLEVIAGHTFWTSNAIFNNLSFDTKKRLISGQIVYYPSEKYRIGIVGGWIRHEEIATQFYEYVKLSEGLMLGLRVTPIKNISVTAVYNPSKQRFLSEEISTTKNNQFQISISFFEILGGGE